MQRMTKEPYATPWITSNRSFASTCWPGVTSTCVTVPAIGAYTDRKEHTYELQSPCNLVCRLLLDKKNRQPHRNVGAPHHQEPGPGCYGPWWRHRCGLSVRWRRTGRRTDRARTPALFFF